MASIPGWLLPSLSCVPEAFHTPLAGALSKAVAVGFAWPAGVVLRGPDRSHTPAAGSADG